MERIGTDGQVLWCGGNGPFVLSLSLLREAMVHGVRILLIVSKLVFTVFHYISLRVFPFCYEIHYGVYGIVTKQFFILGGKLVSVPLRIESMQLQLKLQTHEPSSR